MARRGLKRNNRVKSQLIAREKWRSTKSYSAKKNLYIHNYISTYLQFKYAQIYKHLHIYISSKRKALKRTDGAFINLGITMESEQCVTSRIAIDNILYEDHCNGANGTQLKSVNTHTS